MSKSWYFTYLCNKSIPPTNVMFIKKYNININDNTEIELITNDFHLDIIANVNTANNANNGYDNLIMNAYLFSHIVDISNMISDSADKYGYNVSLPAPEDIPFEKINENIYRIYVKVANGDVNKDDITEISEGNAESVSLLDNELNLRTFSETVMLVDEFDYPDNVWTMGDRYIIIHRYVNDDGDGNNIVRGPIGIVELDPNIPTPQELQQQAQQMLQQALNAPIIGANIPVLNRNNNLRGMRYMNP